MNLMSKILFFLLVPIFLLGQTKYFLPLPIESSSGRPILNATVVFYPAGTTTGGITCTWLSAGRYYYLASDSVDTGIYDIYVNGLSYATNVGLGNFDQASLTQDWQSDIGDSLALEGFINVKRVYGFAGDGTDESAKMTSIISSYSTDTIKLYFPNGNYNISGIDSLELDSNVVIYGEDKNNTILEGDSSLTNNFFRITGENIKFKNLTFKDWQIPIKLYPTSGKAVKDLIIENCRFEDINVGCSNIQQSQVTYGVENVIIKNCEVVNSECGFKFSGKIKGFKAEGNRFKNISSSDASNAACGFVIGDNDYQTYGSGGYTFVNNHFDGIHHTLAKSGVDGYETHGILAYGNGISIVGNDFRYIWNLDQQDSEACYTKGIGTSIVGNTFLDCGSDEGAIAVKGGASAVANTISDNNIRVDTTTITKGTGIYVNHSAMISNNTIVNRTTLTDSLWGIFFHVNSDSATFKLFDNYIETGRYAIFGFNINKGRLWIKGGEYKSSIYTIYNRGTNPQYIKIQDAIIKSDSTYGIYCEADSFITISNCDFDIYQDNTYSVHLVADNITFENNDVYSDSDNSLSGDKIIWCHPENSFNFIDNRLYYRGYHKKFLELSNYGYIDHANISNNKFYIMDDANDAPESFFQIIGDSIHTMFVEDNKYIIFADDTVSYGMRMTSEANITRLYINNNYYDDNISYGLSAWTAASPAVNIPQINMTNEKWNGITSLYSVSGGYSVDNLTKYLNHGDATQMQADSLLFIWDNDTLKLKP